MVSAICPELPHPAGRGGRPPRSAPWAPAVERGRRARREVRVQQLLRRRAAGEDPEVRLRLLQPPRRGRDRGLGRHRLRPGLPGRLQVRDVGRRHLAVRRARHGPRLEETVWNNASGATGSGCSAVEPKPSWQTDTGCARRTDQRRGRGRRPRHRGRRLRHLRQRRGWQVFGGTRVAPRSSPPPTPCAGPPGPGAYPARYPYAAHRPGCTTSPRATTAPASCLPVHRGPRLRRPDRLGTPNGTGAFQATDHKVTITGPGTRHSPGERRSPRCGSRPGTRRPRGRCGTPPPGCHRACPSAPPAAPSPARRRPGGTTRSPSTRPTAPA